ncbi:MAG: hypothetical protein ACTSXW_03140 [Candidatus Baldrarchaeia archaeon]
MSISLYLALEKKDWYDNWISASMEKCRNLEITLKTENMGVFQIIELTTQLCKNYELSEFLIEFPDYASNLLKASNMRFISEHLGKNSRKLVFYIACLPFKQFECEHLLKTNLESIKASSFQNIKASVVSANLYGYNIFFIICRDKQVTNKIKNILAKMQAWLSYLISEWGEDGVKIAPVYEKVIEAKEEADKALEDFLSKKKGSTDRLRKAMRKEVRIRKKADRILTLYHDVTIFLEEIEPSLNTLADKGICGFNPVLQYIRSQIKGLLGKVRSFIILVDKFRESVSDAHEAMVLAKMEEVLTSSEKTSSAVTILNLLLSGAVAFEIVDRGFSALGIQAGLFIPFITGMTLWIVFFLGSWMLLRRLRK